VKDTRPWARLVSLLPVLVALACAPSDQGDAGTAGSEAPVAAEPFQLTVADVGFATPESVLHDDAADVYLVSNINGEPLGKDGNGFISRLRPDGQLEALRWIDGAAEGVTLHAPKGMALKGDTLFVADIDTVRAFHRTSGAPLGGRGVPGATFLNDLAVGPDGTLYVTDSGMDATFSPTGTDAVHRFGAEGSSVVASGAALTAPNGIVVDGESVVMVPFGSNTVHRIPAVGGDPVTLAQLPAGQLDGVVRIGAGVFLVSSWEAGAVYRIAADGTVSEAVTGVEAPADLGWDEGRRRVLIPLFMGNAVEIRDAAPAP
jgi:hypothetical protein